MLRQEGCHATDLTREYPTTISPCEGERATLPLQMWDLLRWEGKHPQAPVSVAAKPHYFCELAVGRSVRALLAAHPAFWRSEQWRACCADGAVLELDRRHFCRVRGKGAGREGGKGGRVLAQGFIC